MRDCCRYEEKLLKSTSLLFSLLVLYGTRLQHRGLWRVHGFLRRLFHADIDQEFKVERGGLKWELNPSDYVQQDIFWYGAKDRWDIFHVKRLLRPGDVILDVGANIGYYSLTLANTLKGNCTVYSIEPVPATFARLKNHIRLNNYECCIDPCQIALSDRTYETSMLVRVGGNSGSATLSCHGKNEVKVNVDTLDNFCEQKNVRTIQFIKIDVEGFEPSVLRGGLKTIEEMAPIILLEVDPPLLRMAKASFEELKSILSKLGYSLYYADRTKLTPFTGLNGNDEISQEVQNVFCLKPVHYERARLGSSTV